MYSLNSPSKHIGLARGNINPLTFEKMDEYSPAKVNKTVPIYCVSESFMYYILLEIFVRLKFLDESK